MRKTLIATLFPLFLVPINVSAQTEKPEKVSVQFNNHVDFGWVGQNKTLSNMFVGYHFTLLNLSRLYTGGLGIGWGYREQYTTIGDRKYVQAQNNLLVTLPVSIKLTSLKRTNKPENVANIYLNISYARNLGENTNGLFLGFSIGPKH